MQLINHLIYVSFYPKELTYLGLHTSLVPQTPFGKIEKGSGNSAIQRFVLCGLYSACQSDCRVSYVTQDNCALNRKAFDFVIIIFYLVNQLFSPPSQT